MSTKVGTEVRIVSWNLQNRAAATAIRQGTFLAALEPSPDLVLLQEVNRTSIDAFCTAAGLKWCRCSIDIRPPDPDAPRGRRLGVAIAGRGSEPTDAFVLPDLPMPERCLIAAITIDGVPMQVISYHAPPGVNWGIMKARQAVGVARYISSLDGPVILGADANTPLVDAIEFADTRTHWHTGRPQLNGEPGDDVLFGPGKIHDLDDALRLWLAQHPDQIAEIASDRPDGPLALSHRTGARKDRLGTARRFDAVWVTKDFSVEGVVYPYVESRAAGSDHSAVIVDLAPDRMSSDRAAANAPG